MQNLFEINRVTKDKKVSKYTFTGKGLRGLYA